MFSVHRLSLFTRLLATFVLLFAIAFGAEAWLVILMGEKTLDASVKDDLSDRARHRFGEVDRFLDDRAAELRSWCAVSFLDGALTHGRVRDIETFLDERRRERTQLYATLTVLDRSQTVIASTDPSALGAALPLDTMTPRSEPGAETRWSALPADPSENPAVIRIAREIRSMSNGQPIGWLVASVRWDAIEQILTRTTERSGAGDTDQFFLLEDATGRVVAGAQPRADAARRPETASDYLAADSAPSGSTAAPLRGFRVHAVWDKRQALGMEPRFVSLVLASAVARLLIAVGVAFVIARYSTSRLRALTEGARVIAGGDLSYRVEERSADEFGELARAFNTMGRELAHARDRLEESLSRWKSLLTHAPDVILAVDRQGKILFVNRVVAGLTVDGVIGTNIGDYTTPEYARAQQAAVERVFRSGEPERLDLEGTGPNSSVAWYSSHIGPVRRDDAIVAVTILTSDITERKRLEREVLEIAESERARIGQDLHDGLGQSLSGLSLLSKVLERQLAAAAPDQAEQARQIRVLVDDTIGHLHMLARGLFPVTLEQEGLRRTLDFMMEGVRYTHGIRYRIRSVDGAEPIEKSRAIQLFRIAQEAVNNAIRHGRARRIAIVLGRNEDGRFLAIRDDGVGFQPDALRGEGIGLRSMRHRAGVLRGTLEFGNAPRCGAFVVCRF
jgi:PAS domain S-box-containing protein